MQVDYLYVSRIAVLIASIAITAGLYHQTVKIWLTRSAGDFTLTLIAALLLNEIAWLNYGVALSEWPIIVISAANLPAAVLAGAGYLKYRR